MALNPDRINFHLSRISKSDLYTFGSEAAQLFDHLRSEIKDNPIFNEYESQINKWKEWPNQEGNSFEYSGQWYLPTDFEESKQVAYTLYHRVAANKENGYGLPVYLIGGRNVSEAIEKFNEIFLELLTKCLNEIINANPEIEENEIEKVKGNTVFIIHGHDELMKKELQLLLYQAGVNNIVLHEQADSGRTIIDKLVEESSKANYAIALFSPDDVLESGERRARQNVILELGYFMGKIGKARVRILIKENTNIPSDLLGILYEKYDSIGAWKVKILKELLAAGIYVDINSAITKI